MNRGILEDYLGTTWRLLGDYLRTIWKQRGGFLRPTCWSFWNHFEVTWCNLGHLVTAFLLSLAQLGPLDEYLTTSSKLQLSEQTFSPCGQQLLFSSNVYCIYDFRIESIGRKYYTQIDLHNPWTQILLWIPSCIVGPSCDFVILSHFCESLKVAKLFTTSRNVSLGSRIKNGQFRNAKFIQFQA